MKTEFDSYAKSYDRVCDSALSVTGEGRAFYAQRRIAHVAHYVQQQGLKCNNLLDYGCGAGASTDLFFQTLGTNHVVGVDISADSIAEAAAAHGSSRASFETIDRFKPAGQFEIAYCNGVFHHIPPARRRAAARIVFEALRPGGLFALWENNPFNPATHFVMSRCEFDRDAVLLSPSESRRLLTDAGLQVIATDFLFIFPRMLKALRPLERAARKLPIGGQYLVLARKNEDVRTF